MSALDEIVGLTFVAAKKALAPKEQNVALHPATVPAVVRHGELEHGGGGSPRQPTPPIRVIAVLGPGATFAGLATTLLPLYTRAGDPRPPTADDLARGLVFYNWALLPTTDWSNHRVGLCLQLPIEIDATTGAWTLDADQVRRWAADFRPEWRPRLTTPPARLDVPEPAQIEGEARALLAAGATPAGQAPALWERVLRNPYEAVLTFLEVVRQLHRAGPTGPGQALTFVEAALDGALPHQLALLAATSAGNGILRRCRAALAATPPPGTDMAELTAAGILVDNALFQGPPGARTLVPHREVPETIDLLAPRPGSAKAAPGAKADPAGGDHRIVLGRDVAVGRTEPARVAGTTFTGPAFAGRVPLDPFLKDDTEGLQAADRLVAGWLVLRTQGRRPQDGLFDAVRARDAGLLAAGLGGWSALDPAGLPALLFRFKDIAPDEFDLHFGLHGLDVDRDAADPTKFRLRKVAADGTTSTVMDAAALRTFLGGKLDAPGTVTFGSDWAARIRLAALVSRRFRRAQALLVLDGVKRTSGIEVAVASVDPFPPKPYVLELDAERSKDLKDKIDPSLQQFLDSLPTTTRSGKTLAGAVIDLTGVTGAAGSPKPAYAGLHDDEMFYVGSMDKAAALYAALELRTRLRLALEAAKANHLDVAVPHWDVPFRAAVRQVWGPQLARGFAGLDTNVQRRFPKLDEIFTFTTVAPWIDFTSGAGTGFVEHLDRMVRLSDGTSAAQIITRIGFPYLNGALRQGGFFDPDPKSLRGIWVSGTYAGNDWADHEVRALSPRGRRHYQEKTNFTGTPRQFALLLALAATGKLFVVDAEGHGDAAACAQMIEIMRKNGVVARTACFIEQSIRATPAGVPQRPAGTPQLKADKFASKIGIGNMASASAPLSGISDCAIIERHHGPAAPAGITLRYVAVFMGGYDNPTLPPGANDPDKNAYERFVQDLDGAVAMMPR